jgi:hypothetical protein
MPRAQVDEGVSLLAGVEAAAGAVVVVLELLSAVLVLAGALLPLLSPLVVEVPLFELDA